MGSIFLPKTPPAALISSIASISASTTVVSLIAIVPLRECNIPTLMVSPAAAGLAAVSGEVVAVGVSPPPQAFSNTLVPRVAEP